jgi:hypothetical protein
MTIPPTKSAMLHDVVIVRCRAAMSFGPGRITFLRSPNSIVPDGPIVRTVRVELLLNETTIVRAMPCTRMMARSSRAAASAATIPDAAKECGEPMKKEPKLDRLSAIGYRPK